MTTGERHGTNPGSYGKRAPDASTRGNDGLVAIRRRYVREAVRAPALDRWSGHRAESEPPYRPRYMVYSGLGSPAMTAERLRTLQELGAESFLLAADLPSQLGFDPDHDLARAQVGRAGVSCATLTDFERICSQVDLAAADSVGMLANSVGHVGLGMVAAVLEDRDARHVKLVMQNDPLKEFTARGTEIFTPEQALRIACDCVAFAIDEDLAGWPITVCSNHYDVAGAGPLLAAAFAFANGIAYVDELLARGYAISDVAKKMMFFLNERSDLFVEASVFRTARLIWSEILEERYGLELGDQPQMTLMGYAHGLETSEEPLVNVARCTLSVAGSVLGGVDYLCASSYDEALRIPSVDAAALSLRTMQVVGNEHGVAASIDPLAGSVELSAVDTVVYERVREELDDILQRGGALEGIRSGYIAHRINEGRGTRESQLSSGARAWVGVNTLRAPQHRSLFTGRSSGELDFGSVEESCRDSISRHRAERDSSAVDAAREAVAEVAATQGNLVPPTRAALRAGATLQEIIEATRSGFGSVSR